MSKKTRWQNWMESKVISKEKINENDGCKCSCGPCKGGNCKDCSCQDCSCEGCGC